MSTRDAGCVTGVVAAWFLIALSIYVLVREGR